MINLDFEKMNGLIPVVTQDYQTLEVLIVGFMNKEALRRTLETGKVCYYSRTHKRIWLKGDTSGNIQLVRELLVNCENNSLLIQVEQIGGACHDGYKSCFYRRLEDGLIISERVFDPQEVYKE